MTRTDLPGPVVVLDLLHHWIVNCRIVNDACTARSTTPQSSYVNAPTTPIRDDLKGSIYSDQQTTIDEKNGYTRVDVCGSAAAAPHINTPTRADLENDGYSDPRYHGEVNQERGSLTVPQTKTTDAKVYTLPDSSVSNAATYVNTPTRADLEAEGYSDPRYYGEVDPNKGCLSDRDDATTPTRADLEGDGYSDPRYHGEVNQERGSLTVPQTKTTDANVYTLPDSSVSNAAAYVNTPTRADLEAEGYSDPRYYGEVDPNKGCLSDRDDATTPTRADLEGDGYSDPRYHGEGSLTEYTDPQSEITGENDYTLPDLCVSNAAAYINTPTRADLEAEGYSDPRYYGEVNPNKGCLSDHSDATTPSRANLEGDGYSDPRYHGEVDQGRSSSTECTDPQTKTTDENVYTLPDLCVSNAAAYVNTPDPCYYGDVDVNKDSLSDDSTRPDLCGSNSATQHSKSRYINTPTRADLEAEGYSDPRYYGDWTTRGTTTDIETLVIIPLTTTLK